MSVQGDSGGHSGIVASIEGDVAVVRFQRTDMCGGCHACVSFSDKEMEIRVKNALNAHPGDRVQVAIGEKRVSQAAWIAYGIPLVLLIAGVALGSLLSDAAGIVTGLAGCAAAFVVLKVIDKKANASGKFQPRMERIIMEENAIGSDSAPHDGGL